MADRQNDTLGSRLRRLQQDIVDFKSSQPVGKGSVRVFNIQSNAQYDYEWISDDPFSSGFPSTSVYVTYYADTQQAPFAALRIVGTIDGEPFDPLTPYIVSSIPGVKPAFTVSQETFGSSSIEYLAQSNIYRWQVEMSSPATTGVVFRFKVLIKATDSGRFTLSTQL